MAKKDFKKEDEQLENVNEALSTTAQWIIDHQNILTWILTGIIAVILVVLAVNAWIVKPHKQQAANENAKAEAYFLAGDFEKALNGDEAECIGFAEIADNYGLYQEGKLAALYAGICHYEMGDKEAAVEQLAKFSAKDVNIAPAAAMKLGDVYVELEEYDHAAKAFCQAAESHNSLLAPMALKKLGFVCLKQDDKKGALKDFQTIKDEYPQDQYTLM